MTVIGLGAGLLGAAAVSRVLAGLLHDMSALDPVTFAVAPLVLGVTALAANWIPARRATKVDPMVALRAE